MEVLASIHCQLKRFAGDRRAMGAVEFAMIAPFLLLLYLGGSQISMALTINRKIQHVAATINDLVTQSTTLSSLDIQGIFNISKSIITPYDIAPLGIRVTSVVIDAAGLQKTEWSCVSGTLKKAAKGTAFALPASFSTLRDRHILVAETRYGYKPVAGYSATGAFEMGGVSYLNPRNGATVELTGAGSNGC